MATPGCWFEPLICGSLLLAAADPARCGWGAAVLSSLGDVQAAGYAAGSSPGNIAATSAALQMDLQMHLIMCTSAVVQQQQGIIA
jgi:hypothetical protein